jgi:hypothetical protein
MNIDSWQNDILYYISVWANPFNPFNPCSV